MSKLLKCIAGVALLVTSAGCEQSVVAFPSKDAGPPPCGAGTTQCGEQCVNLEDDPNHCGSCDRACAASEDCAASQCSRRSVCEPGQDCALVDPCHVGKTACTAGVQSCVDSAVPQPNGTACGIDQVCVDGACTACQEGAACQPTNRCQVGVRQCGTPSGPTCAPTQLQPPGTVCDTNAVCGVGGVCTPCTAGASCTTNVNQCMTGTVVCTSGAPVCVDDADKAPGSECTGGVCNAGTCVACTQGATCTTNVNPCMTGQVVCTSGAPVCVDDADKAPGSECTGGVCNAGTCIACTQGATCTSNPTECRSGSVDCASGTPTCTDGAAKTPGTVCTPSGGGPGVCSAGVCNACTAGAACTVNLGNPCKLGVTQCSTGEPVCADDADASDGTSCESGAKECLAGACTRVVITVTVDSNTSNVNLAALAGNSSVPVALTGIINSGVVVSSADAGSPALTVGSLPAGSTVRLVNNGIIRGAGGAGGRGAYVSTINGISSNGLPGEAGGAAVTLTLATTIDNTSGSIEGGGGGGGGGGNCHGVNMLAGGGGGGGGAGELAGGGGAKGVAFSGIQYSDGVAGSGGGATPGGGGGGGNWGGFCFGGAGGAGGAYGTPGVDGSPGTASVNRAAPGTGGAAGAAVSLNGFTVTWVGGNNASQVVGPVQ